MIDTALAAAGPLTGRIVVDTTNQFGPGGVLDLGHTAARHNADRMPGARYTKCFNTLTARFQGQAASRTGHARVVQWICGDDTQAKAILGQLVDDAGYVPVDLGRIDQCAVMEAPRRPGAVYGEEYRAAVAVAVVEVVEAVRNGCRRGRSGTSGSAAGSMPSVCPDLDGGHRRHRSGRGPLSPSTHLFQQGKRLTRG